jgi:hypothetical protein
MKNKFKIIFNVKKVIVMQQAIGMAHYASQDKHIKALAYLARIIHALVVRDFFHLKYKIKGAGVICEPWFTGSLEICEL